MTVSTTEDLSGRVVGNWRLMRRLGEGGFGAVYEAQHLSIQDRRAAVKILHQHMAFNDDLKRRFVNEATAASRAEHENVVQLFDAGMSSDGLCYSVMELLRGQPLSEALAEGALGWQRSIAIGKQVAAALQAAHQLGIVHRDLKPDNIFLVQRGRVDDFVKVLDFGIAKLNEDTNAPMTHTGVLMGTPTHMSPEQWKTLRDIDGRSDLYTLGVILFQCVTGHLPFSGNTPYEWLDAHLNQAPPDLTALNNLPQPLGLLIGRLLAKERDDWPRDAGEVIEALEAIRLSRAGAQHSRERHWPALALQPERSRRPVRPYCRPRWPIRPGPPRSMRARVDCSAAARCWSWRRSRSCCCARASRIRPPRPPRCSRRRPPGR